MEALHEALLELQQIDDQIAEAESRLAAYEPRYRELEEPVRTLEQEVEGLRTRVGEMRLQVRKLEQGADSKREKLRAYEQRMERVRSVREESAAKTELDLVRRAADADETEALEMGEQATRTELRFDELTKQLEKMRGELEPKRAELDLEKNAAADALTELKQKRENHVTRLDKPSVRLYERVRGGRSRTALAPLTSQGACGACFSTLPLQEQSEVRNSKTLHRCEACGVILYSQDE